MMEDIQKRVPSAPAIWWDLLIVIFQIMEDSVEEEVSMCLDSVDLKGLEGEEGKNKHRDIDQQNMFCRECQEIDFRSLANLDLEAVRRPFDGLGVAQLGSRCVRPPTNSCGLCQFFHDSIRDMDTSCKTLSLRACSILQTHLYFEDHLRMDYNATPEQDLICLHVVNSDANLLRFDKGRNRPILIKDTTDCKRHFFTPAALPNFVNLDVARQWLDYCRSYHPYCHAQPGSTIGLQLIDCYTHILVRQHSEDYLALSYVWGSVEHEDPHPAATPFPKTIWDAVYLTKALGFRYLWVDKYCIDQNNKEGKKNQIQQMDSIYRNAVMTIVAASGADANSGLTGMKGTPRKRQPILSVGSLTLINTMTHPHHTISKSVWNTRSWTLQESAVSTRKLFFMEEQIYFECLSMNCHESITHDLPELHRISRDWKRQSHPAMALPSVIERPDDEHGIERQLYRFTKLRRQYTKRRLSYEADSLNAFLGILRYLELPVPSEDGQEMFWLVNIWGVPYVNSSTSTPDNRLRSFMNQLVWMHAECLWSFNSTGSVRRSDFPSWSWVGWEGEVRGRDWLQNLHEIGLEPFVETAHLELEYDSSNNVAFADLPANFTNANFNYSQPLALHFDADIIPSENINVDLKADRQDINDIEIQGSGITLYLSTGPRDRISMRNLIETRRYLFAIMYQSHQSMFIMLLLEDHGDYCTRVGIASLSSDEDTWPKTVTRRIRLM